MFEMTLIPLEILDSILIYVNRLDICLEFRRFSIIQKTLCVSARRKMGNRNWKLEIFEVFAITEFLKFQFVCSYFTKNGSCSESFSSLNVLQRKS